MHPNPVNGDPVNGSSEMAGGGDGHMYYRDPMVGVSAGERAEMKR